MQRSKEGDIDAFLEFLHPKCTPVSVIYNQKTPLQNTFLHVTASFGNEDLVWFTVQHFPSLHFQKNHRGDTALHVAAAAGHLGVVDILLRYKTDHMRKHSLLDVHKESTNEAAVEK